MTNELFRGYLECPIQRTKPVEPMMLTDRQVEYFASVTGITTEDARAIANKILSLPDLQPAKPAFLLTKRATALAAKQRQGHGPPSPGGWRGKERTTKYRSH